jgi:heptosyltransferase-2
MNILIRMPNWIGDLVMATPLIRDLRRHFPSASLTAMARRPICQLLEKDPHIDELFSFEKPPRTLLRRDEKRSVIAKLRGGKFEIGVLTPNSFSSAWWFWQGGVRRRIGFSGGWRRWLLTDPIPMPPRGSEHQVELYKRLLAPLGIAGSKTLPYLVLDGQDRAEAQELLRQRGYQKGTPLIGINPGAAYGSAKCWLPERFRSLAEQLLSEGNDLVFFGDTATAPLVKEICRNLPQRAMDLSGATSLRELMAAIELCDLLVTNDSGPMHIAAALGVPVVALFGSTDDRATGPYGQAEGVIHKRPRCSPCFQRKCPIDFRCMKEITVEEVVKKVRERHRIV